jgi:CheY-like chemotaxis protein
LVVDDEEDIRDLIGRFLRGLGFAVACVSDGEAALSYLARMEPISLVLSNLRMPRMGGAALFHRVVEICPSLSERFVFCSGDLVSEPSRQFLHRCGRPYLEKPFELETLAALTRQYAALPAIRLDGRAVQRLLASRRYAPENAPLPIAIGEAM